MTFLEILSILHSSSSLSPLFLLPSPLHRLGRTTAVSTAEALRERIAAIADLLRVDGLTVSASIGLAQYGEDDTVEEALAGADRALYEAKNGGRDRVVADAA